MTSKLEEVEEKIAKESISAEQRERNRYVTQLQGIINAFDQAEAEDQQEIADIVSGKDKKMRKLKDSSGSSSDQKDLPPFTPQCIGCEEMREVVTNELGTFSKFIYLSIIANIIFIALDGHDISEGTEQLLWIANIIFTCIFSIEALVKNLTLGPYGYFGDSYNVFDFILVII